MDVGFLYENQTEIQNIKISNYVPDQVPSTKDSLGYNVIYNVEIDADHFRTVTYVRFQKIQEALATMGGIISIMKVIFTLLLMGIYNFSFPLVLFREVYLKGEEKIKLDKNKSQQNLNNLHNIKIHNKNLDDNNNFQYTNPNNFLNLKKLQLKKNKIKNYNEEEKEKDYDVITRNMKVIKLDNQKNNIFGNDDYKKNYSEGGYASNNIIKTDVINYLNNRNIMNRETVNNNNNNDVNYQSFNNIPDVNCDKNPNINANFNQVSKINRNPELINNDNFRSSKRKFDCNQFSGENSDLDNMKNVKTIYRKRRISENEEDNSNNRIISTNDKKVYDILNRNSNPIDILKRDFDKKKNLLT